MILCNGHTRDGGLDRGLQFGDGHFTTLRVANGQPLWWRYHWQRLCDASQRLFLPAPEQSLIEQGVTTLAAQQLQAVIKVIITRGSGGRGYAAPNEASPNTYVSVSPLPDLMPRVERVEVADLKLAQQPALAGLKTLNRLEQVLLAKERTEKAVDDLLVLDHQNHVIECCQGNIFWRCGAQWFTPSLQQAGVAGVARQVIIDQQWLGAVAEGDFSLSQLYQADQAFICTSVRGAVPIHHLNGKVLATELPDSLNQLTAC